MKHYKCGMAGEHINQVSIKSPDWWESSKSFFNVDSCVASEIVFLIVNGVRTLNSCCGHGKTHPSVCVDPDTDSVSLMHELGYKQDPDYPDRPEIFKLKGESYEKVYMG